MFSTMKTFWTRFFSIGRSALATAARLFFALLSIMLFMPLVIFLLVASLPELFMVEWARLRGVTSWKGWITGIFK